MSKKKKRPAAATYNSIKSQKDFIRRVTEVHDEIGRKTAIHEAKVWSLNKTNVAFFCSIPANILESEDFTPQERERMINLMAILTMGLPITGADGLELVGQIIAYRDKHGTVDDWHDSLYYKLVESVAEHLM